MIRFFQRGYPVEYYWSSAAGHCRQKRDELLDHTFPEPEIVTDWANGLIMDNREQEERICRATKRCRR